jgi:large subunit ribosomal protein L29
MKAAKLREHSPEELRQAHDDTAREIRELKAKKGVGSAPEQPLRIRTLRRNLARIKTVMKQREVAEHA